MYTLISLGIVLIFSLLFAKYIKKYPVVFYVLALAVAAYIISFRALGVSLAPLPKMLSSYILKGGIPGAFFIVVMYIGAFNDRFSIVKRLKSIRAELAIIGTIVTLAHNIALGFFGKAYFLNIFHGIQAFKRPERYYAAWASAILICLMIPLAITSFKSVRKRMSQASWKKLHKLAYLFYFLTFVHVSFLWIPVYPKFAEEGITYTIIFVVYVILRSVKYMRDKKQVQAA